jgi:hypothetical protein
VSRRLAVLALCVVLAGCSVALPGGTGTPTPTPTTTPAPVPTDTATPTPERVAPGLTTAGVVDAAALLGVHTDAYGREPYAVQFSERRVRGGAATVSYAGLARVGTDCREYGVGVYQPRPAPPRLTQWYANGTVALSRSFTANVSTTDPGVGFTDPAPTVVTADGLPADPCAVRPLDPTFAATLRVLYDSLDFAVVRRGDGAWLTAAGGTVPRLPVTALGGEPVRNVTVREVRVTLAPSGAVTALQLRYAGETAAGGVEGRVSVRYEGLAGPVEPPWPASATER